MDIDRDLVKIVTNELGENMANLFINFFEGFPKEEQIKGVNDILTLAIGKSRTKEILNRYLSSKK